MRVKDAKLDALVAEDYDGDEEPEDKQTTTSGGIDQPPSRGTDQSTVLARDRSTNRPRAGQIKQPPSADNSTKAVHVVHPKQFTWTSSS